MKTIGKRMTIERMMEQVFPEPNTGCWLWSGKVNHNGYGAVAKFLPDKILRGAHRVSYYLHNGIFDYSLHVCHKCDTPSCVNPDHLFLATKLENTMDMVRKGRASKGENCPNHKLTESNVIDIRKLYSDGGHTIRSIAPIFGVDYSTIFNIVKRKTWKHVK